MAGGQEALRKHAVDVQQRGDTGQEGMGIKQGAYGGYADFKNAPPVGKEALTGEEAFSEIL